MVDVDYAGSLTNEACGKLLRGCDGAGDGEVADGGAIDEAEGCSIVGCRAIVEGERVAIAVEDAIEEWCWLRLCDSQIIKLFGSDRKSYILMNNTPSLF